MLDGDQVRRPWWKRIGYSLIRHMCRIYFAIVSQIRIKGVEKLPIEGGALICSNHQSHFDPVLVGVAFRRRLNYLARRSLFDFPVLKWLISYLDAIPIEREGMGIGGIKETLRRLKRGEAVLIFPEGTRSLDGQIAPLKPGFFSIAKRSKCPVVPVAIAGAYEVWPRHRWLPGIGRIAVYVGEPISPEAIREMDEEDLIQELTHRIKQCFAEARELAGIR
jgi:1-acyl-sn-glycerol-3-phosphate acyltransferase